MSPLEFDCIAAEADQSRSLTSLARPRPSSICLLPRARSTRTPLTLPASLHPLVPSGMDVDPKPRLVAGCRKQRGVLPFRGSLLAAGRNEKMLMDTSLVQGRSFRVGWASNWTLTHIGRSNTHAQKGFSYIL